MARERSREGGFTLLETLVALTILAGAAATLFALIASGRRIQGTAEADTAVALDLRSLLARVGRDIRAVPGTQSGRTSSGQAWSVTVAPFTDPAAPLTPNLLLVRAKVERNGETAEATTLRLTP
jgi:prepilin-type N-terminal cleavage/methylation domain-containing protein